MPVAKDNKTSTASAAEALSEGTTKHFPNASQSLTGAFRTR